MHPRSLRDRLSFRLTGITSGTYSLIAEATGKARRTVSDVAVSPSAVLELDLPLSPEARISGTVTDQSGNPIPSFGLILHPADPDSGTAFSVNGVAGVFTGSHIEAGTYHAAAYADGYLTGWSSNVTLTAGSTVQTAPFVLSPAAAITGRVIDRRGGSDAPLMIGAFQSDELIAGAFVAEDNSYTILGLPTGTYTIKPLLLPGTGVVSETQIAINAAETNNASDITVYAGATILGRVSISNNGEPAAGISVRLHQPDGTSANALTSTNGQFSFAGLPAGTHRVGLDPAGMFADQTIQVTNVDRSTHQANFIINPVARLDGTVRLASGTPVAGASVTLKENNNYLATAVTGSDGNYSLLFLSAGTFTLQARSPVATFPETEPIVVSIGQAINREIESGTSRIDIAPPIAYGTNAPAGFLRVLSHLDEPLLSTSFERGQGIVLTNVAAGTYRLAFESGLSFAGDSFQDVLPGQTSSVRPSLTTRLQLLGAVLSARTDLPILGATVMIVRSADGVPIRSCVTGENGSYVLANLEPEQYDVIAYASGYARGFIGGVFLGSNAVTNILLSEDTVPLLGRVLSSGGWPIADAGVTAVDERDLPHANAVTSPDGAFAVLVPAGVTIRLRVAGSGFAPHVSSPLTVTAGGIDSLVVILAPVCVAPNEESPPSSGDSGSVPSSGSALRVTLARGPAGGVQDMFFNLLDWFAEPWRSEEHTD